MKLFRITTEVEFFVVAEDEEDAIQVASNHGSEAFRDTYDVDYFASEINSLSEVPKDWRDCYPYGDSGDLNCRQVMESSDNGSAEQT